jgi:hypothetical protein
MRRFVRSSQERKIIASKLKSVADALQRVNEGRGHFGFWGSFFDLRFLSSPANMPLQQGTMCTTTPP